MDSKHHVYINASQIRAARALLNWSQDELATASGLSIATIRKIESGHISPRDKTMEAIVSTLEQSKIVFLSSGVRVRNNDVVTLEGDDCYLQLLDDIHHTTKGKKGEALFIYADPRLVTEEEIQSFRRLRKHGLKWRFIAEEGNTHIFYPLEEFRWMPKRFFKRNIQVIYGSKIAVGITIDRSRNLTTKILVIDSAPLAESTRNLFEFMWENCRKPPHTTAPEIYE